MVCLTVNATKNIYNIPQSNKPFKRSYSKTSLVHEKILKRDTLNSPPYLNVTLYAIKFTEQKRSLGRSLKIKVLNCLINKKNRA